MAFGPSGLKRRVALGCVLLFVGLFPLSCALAQTPQERLSQAEGLLARGDYGGAREAFESLLHAEGLEQVRVLRGLATTLLETGEYDAAIDQLRQYRPAGQDGSPLAVLHARALMETGRFQLAEALLEEVEASNGSDPEVLLAVGQLLESTGRKREAYDRYASLYRAYRGGAFETASQISAAGVAAARLEQFREANEAFSTAHQLEPAHLENLRRWAQLFADKFNAADAERTFEEGLQVNPVHPGLNLGYARVRSGYGAQEEYAGRALQTNPKLVGALVLLAELRILDAQYEEATALIEQALAVNPASVDALAQRASIELLQADSLAFLRTEAQALSVNSTAGGFYVAVSENLMRRFRYPDAAVIALQGTRVERDNPRVFAVYGASLLRVGRFEQARRYLEASFDRDPFDLFTGNTLRLLDEFESFHRLESEHFELYVHADDRPLVGHLILNEAERALDALSERYPYRPSGKIRLEAYNDHDDFAVRVGGIPHLGLLGVCFGDVVAFDTPGAQRGEAYNWARTLWHELAHTMAIGVSGYRVPRWFTEGLSVYEEWRARPEWYRKQDLELQIALERGMLLPLKEIDQGFTRPQYPGQIMMSYVHASRIVGYIVDRFGFEAIVDILQRLGTGQDIARAMEQTLGLPLDAVDYGFRLMLTGERQELAFLLDRPIDMLQEGADEKAVAGRHPFFADLRKGGDLLETGQLDEAERILRASIERYPRWTRPGNAYERLAEVYRRKEDERALRSILEQYLGVTEFGAAESRELAGLLERSGDRRGAERYWRRSLEVDPYDPDARRSLAQLVVVEGRPADAVAEWQALLALRPVDESDVRFQLAQSLYAAGDRVAAKRALLQALELAPGFRDAQKLLLEWVDGSS